MGQFGYPLAQFHRESFWRGEIPFWNPYNNCGLPFLAQWNTLVLYPGSLIYLLLPLPFGMNIFVLAHVFLAAAGMYSLALRWTNNRFAASVAGLAFAWNGLTLHALMWPNNIAALGWMPWVVLALERVWTEGGRRIPIAALIGAMQMLTGAPEIIFLTWVVVGLLWLRDFLGGAPVSDPARADGAEQTRRVGDRRSVSRAILVLRLGCCGALVFLLSSAQLLPFVDLLRHSNRDASFGGAAWAMPLWGVANFFVPLFGESASVVGVYSQDAQQWTSSYYVGIGTVAFALLAWRARDSRAKWVAGLALAGLILSLGDGGQVLPILKKILPPLGFIRFPIKYVVLVVFALPLLAAFGVKALLHLHDSRRARSWLSFVFAGLLAVVVVITALARLDPMPGAVQQVVWRNATVRILFLLMTLGVLSVAGAARFLKPRFAFAAVLLCMAADVLCHTPAQNPVISNRAYGPLPSAMASVPTIGQSRAMIAPPMQQTLSGLANPDPFVMFTGHRRMLLSDCNLIDHVPKVNGFFSLYVREADEVTRRLYRTTNYADLPLLDFLGVSQLSAANELFAWQARTNALPLVTAGQTPAFASPEKTFDAIFKSDFDPGRIVYLPNEAREAASSVHSNAARVVSSGVGREKIFADVETAGAAIVVFAQAHYDGWKAFMDGKPAPVWKANYAYQSVIVPNGRHRVELRYDDRLFRYGAMISFLTLLACAGFAVFGKRAAS